MPKTKISEYSATANSNTDVASINIDEGCAPSGINNAIRAIMGHLKDFQSGTSNDPFTVGSSGSLTLSYGTANGVAYLNGSKVLTTGSALTFDGTNVDLGTVGAKLNFATTGSSTRNYIGGSADGYSLEMVMQRGASQPLSYKQNYSVGHEWGIAGSGAMTLTSTGLGIGASSPAKRLDVRQAYTADTVVAQIGNTNNGNGSTPVATIFDFTEANGTPVSRISSIYTQSTGKTDLAFGTYNSGLSEKMRLDSSGNLGLGVTPSAWDSRTAFQNGAASMASTSANRSVAEFSANSYLSSGGIFRYIYTANASLYQQVTGEHRFFTASSGTAGNAITFTQAMTLDASGNLLVGTTSALGKFTVEQNLGGVGDSVGIKDTGSAYGSGAVYISFRNNAGSVAGKIEHTASTTVNYNTSSDARLKRNIGIATDTSVIDQIVIHDFEWKEDSRVDRGVFAQEAHQIKSSAVSVGTDETNDDGVLLNPWGVDYSKFVPDIIVHAQQLKKTVQEQQAIIQSLTARITALEGA